MPLVSVIIPTYNRAHLILETIESVLSQTINDLELIVIDDGSTDSTASVLREIDDPRVHLIFQKNQGPGLINMVVGYQRALHGLQPNPYSDTQSSE